MSRFEEIQKRLDELSPIPINMPKLYLLGDTGAGKTTIVRRILGTDKLKFPSVQQKRTTVAVTEYVLSKDLPYRATYLFKSRQLIANLVAEILEIAIENAYSHFRKDTISKDGVTEDLEETPDERFRLRYILTLDQREELAVEIIEFMPALDATVKKLTREFNFELQSCDEELGVVVALALDNHKDVINALNAEILRLIEVKVAEVCNGHRLYSDPEFYQHSSNDLNAFVDGAKLLLSSTKDSISPVVEYARLQGNLLAPWLPSDVELVLIDGEGIGHDTREASRLSPRHLDYFHFADAIGLVEECKKPFASGGKSAIEGIVRNGYAEKFHLIFTKLDEVEVGEDEEPSREDQIRAVRKGLTNVKHALKDDGAELDIGADRFYYLAHMNSATMDSDSVSDVARLLASINAKFSEAKPQFVQPIYDYEMLSSYLSKSADSFLSKWNTILHAKHWQTIKAFNRRMCWEEDGFRDMEPIADFHAEVTRELEYFISHPSSWVEAATPSMQERSIANVKQEFSKHLLTFARVVILKTHSPHWGTAMSLSGMGSTTLRMNQIQRILEEVLPEHRKPTAIKMKDSIKQLLASAVAACEA
ncbi:hypothetical protein WM43_16270 [Aeromonas veronii]|uniref:Uncharacterized protein n=1 Tax=Aeromonas veronii TaxID=654 RepID=A0AAC9B9J6_AERVE|nr:hypothetical protein [Aeromonas veronii]ANB54093.1 hypothetical protein WM43_16270 [Aeromonas veronii]